jgi:CelD/BcsL family acetyltransferase involved in cellulose biosynthesis
MSRPIANFRPLAADIGPFADPVFLEVAHRHHGRGPLVDVVGPGGRVVLEEVEGVLAGVGHRDVVDYRSPLGDGAADLLVELTSERPLTLDSVPEDTARALAEVLAAAGRSVEVSPSDRTAILELPATADDWLAAIGKKERHETRRKRRRYEAEVGTVAIGTFDRPGPRLDEFVALHRTAPGDKGSFMTDPMADYFSDLLSLDGWSIRALLDPEGVMVAAGFGATVDGGYYLYNSAFDVARADASPGVVLVAALVEAGIDEGLVRFDFLKGDEAYKYRLGAVARQLADLNVHP